VGAELSSKDTPTNRDDGNDEVVERGLGPSWVLTFGGARGNLGDGRIAADRPAPAART